MTTPSEQTGQSPTKEFKFIEGAVLRLAMLMTFYRSPIDFTDKRLKEAEIILGRWGKACIPCNDLPPVELLEALCDDLNTPKMIALMHKYRKEDGKRLFASLNYLGFFNEGVCFPSEIKTLPDNIPASFGPDCISKT